MIKRHLLTRHLLSLIYTHSTLTQPDIYSPLLQPLETCSKDSCSSGICSHQRENFARPTFACLKERHLLTRRLLTPMRNIWFPVCYMWCAHVDISRSRKWRKYSISNVSEKREERRRKVEDKNQQKFAKWDITGRDGYPLLFHY